MIETKEKRTPFLGNRGLRDGSVTMEKLADDVKETIHNIKGQQGPQGTSAIWDGDAEVLTELEHTTGQATNRTMSQKGITDIIEGIDNVNYEEITEGFSAVGKYYSIPAASSGTTISGPKDATGFRCAKVSCAPGDKFRIRGLSGTTGVQRLYCFVTGNVTIIERGASSVDTRQNPLVVTAPATATFLVVNFKSYDSTTDHLEKVVETHTKGIQENLNETVRFTQQTLTAGQQAQVITNLGLTDLDKAVKVTAQSFTTSEKSQALTNLGISTIPSDMARIIPLLPEIYYHGTSTLSPGHSNILIPIDGDGVYRVTVNCISNTSNTSKARLFYRKSSDNTVNIYASKDTPQRVPVTLAWTWREGYDTLQITMTGSPSETFDVLVEKIDTPLAKQQNNKAILIFGDSLSQVDAQNAGTSQRDAMRWSDWVRCYRPGVTIHNLAIGGTRYAQRADSLSHTPGLNKAWAAVDIVNLVKAVCSGDYTYQQEAAPVILDGAGKEMPGIVIQRAQQVNLSKVTDVVLMAGTNDWAGDNALGTVDSTDITTTLGALNTIITDLLTAMPQVRIHIATETVRYKGSTYTDAYFSDNWHNANNQTLADLMEDIMTVARKWHIPVIDLYWGLGWNKLNMWQYIPSTDGTHPLYGLDVIAEKITRKVFSC